MLTRYQRCLALNNFSTLIHIIAGLNSTPIHRLRRTWETMSSKSMLALGTLNRTIRPDKNYKDYRELLRGVAPPCVPFLGTSPAIPDPPATDRLSQACTSRTGRSSATATPTC